MTYICTLIRPEYTGQAAQLLHYFSLGSLIQEKAWSQEAKNLVKKLIESSNRLKNFLIIPQQTYYLYRARGSSYLYSAWSITLYVLQRLYQEDFAILQAEAQFLAQQEIDEVLDINYFTGAQQAGEANVTN
ncbi:hypothetical protein F8M41_006713 [Gigaspora margarita]|uniref:Uncharacterized protein n=1 Tax=Gigaspora margarita TaxID=4874 RepID=A0A8H4A4V9_GIGMA|nr:hypothetical protein F8M41_006713 [Gigaspora margarita]